MAVVYGDRSEQGIRFHQLKTFGISNEVSCVTDNLLAVDHKRRYVFVCNTNQFIFCPFPSLTSYETVNPSITNTVDTDIANKCILVFGPENLHSHLVSISCRGFGSKLALCAKDISTGSTIVNFYDVEKLYQDRTAAKPYNRFLPLENGATVQSLAWHPEYSDSIFACLLSDGTFYMVYISDPTEDIFTILVHYKSPLSVNAFAWSPKGKQIVLAFKNVSDSHFAQFKVKIDESNLVENTGFEQMRKFQLPADFAAQRIARLCWISTYNFMAICYSDENKLFTTTLVVVPKASKDESTLTVVDYGCLTLSMSDDGCPDSSYQQIENSIFIYSNTSLQIGILFCEPSKDVSVPANWFQCEVDDSNSMDCGDPKGAVDSICGLGFLQGDGRKYQMKYEQVGGSMSNYFFLYTRSGLLKLYIQDFENGSSGGFISIPKEPSKIIKPVSRVSSKTTSALPETTKPTFGVTVPLGSSVAAPKPVQKASALQPQTLQKCETVTSALSTTAPTQFSNEIDKILTGFNQVFMKRCQKIKKSIGMFPSKKNYQDLAMSNDFLKDLLDKFNAQMDAFQADVRLLWEDVGEMKRLLDDIEAYKAQNCDPVYLDILKKKLEPGIDKFFKQIKSKVAYLSIKLNDLELKLDLEWKENIHKKYNPVSKQTNPYDYILMAIEYHQRLIDKWTDHLDENFELEGQSELDLNSLNSSFTNMSFENGKTPRKPFRAGSPYYKSIRVEKYSPEQMDKLMIFLKNRSSIPHQVCSVIDKQQRQRVSERVKSIKERINLDQLRAMPPKPQPSIVPQTTASVPKPAPSSMTPIVSSFKPIESSTFANLPTTKSSLPPNPTPIVSDPKPDSVPAVGAVPVSKPAPIAAPATKPAIGSSFGIFNSNTTFGSSLTAISQQQPKQQPPSTIAPTSTPKPPSDIKTAQVATVSPASNPVKNIFGTLSFEQAFVAASKSDKTGDTSGSKIALPQQPAAKPSVPETSKLTQEAPIAAKEQPVSSFVPANVTFEQAFEMMSKQADKSGSNDNEKPEVPTAVPIGQSTTPATISSLLKVTPKSQESNKSSDQLSSNQTTPPTNAFAQFTATSGIFGGAPTTTLVGSTLIAKTTEAQGLFGANGASPFSTASSAIQKFEDPKSSTLPANVTFEQAFAMTLKPENKSGGEGLFSQASQQPNSSNFPFATNKFVDSQFGSMNICSPTNNNNNAPNPVQNPFAIQASSLSSTFGAANLPQQPNPFTNPKTGSLFGSTSFGSQNGASNTWLNNNSGPAFGQAAAEQTSAFVGFQPTQQPTFGASSSPFSSNLSKPLFGGGATFESLAGSSFTNQGSGLFGNSVDQTLSFSNFAEPAPNTSFNPAFSSEAFSGRRK